MYDRYQPIKTCMTDTHLHLFYNEIEKLIIKQRLDEITSRMDLTCQFLIDLGDIDACAELRKYLPKLTWVRQIEIGLDFSWALHVHSSNLWTSLKRGEGVVNLFKKKFIDAFFYVLWYDEQKMGVIG